MSVWTLSLWICFAKLMARRVNVFVVMESRSRNGIRWMLFFNRGLFHAKQFGIPIKFTIPFVSGGRTFAWITTPMQETLGALSYFDKPSTSSGINCYSYSQRKRFMLTFHVLSLGPAKYEEVLGYCHFNTDGTDEVHIRVISLNCTNANNPWISL